ncbi:ADP-ribosylation factor 1-like 1 [Teleopsis dalmanni]|uniref:ADP-ribosylation factor 1-like 1 n=1 Tax=Teleopsis dalmanni TaxID=139649 RepID=UPI0018CF729A|nr:ADP-ribosylation factor 1-like 1 [Teleopsis dalmanni]
MSCICLGPKRSGKTHLLKALQDPNSIDETSYSMPTIGTNIFTIKFPKVYSTNDKPIDAELTDGNTKETQQSKGSTRQIQKSIQVLEIGGTMASLWRQYFNDVQKLIYVVDTSNLCQISAAGVLLYSILAEPRLQKVKILIVLTKMDYAYRQMRNEAILMLQMSKLRKQIRQNVTIVEASAVSGKGFNVIYDWLQNAL